MKFAAFETSTEWCSVALWHRRGDHRHRGTGRQPAFGTGAADARTAFRHATGIAVAHLDAVAFGAGPGSFTGLRIACGVAQGIAFARGMPVDRRLDAGGDRGRVRRGARRRLPRCAHARSVLFGASRRRAGRWREVIPAHASRPRRAPNCRVRAGSAAGTGLPPTGPMGCDRVMPDIHPTAMAVARLAAPRLAAGEGVDAALAMPVYVRDKVAFTDAKSGSRDERGPQGCAAACCDARRRPGGGAGDRERDLFASLDARQFRRFAARRLPVLDLAQRRGAARLFRPAGRGRRRRIC